MSQANAIRIEGLTKIYKGRFAVVGASFDVPTGSVFGLLGENGAGKSTLLRMIAGLIEPSRGIVRVLGGDAREREGRVAYMSHAAMLYDELSAGENLRYFGGLRVDGCGLCGGSPEMALRAVGLDPHLKRPVGQYSQGMRQRTSLARVVQSDPEVLLLDEPFSNLDVDSAHAMVKLLADFRTWPIISGPAAGIGRRTIILTTHQSHLGAPIADRVLTMRAGKIVSDVAGGVEA